MKLNHKFALLLAGAVLAGSLTGCGASGTPASSAASSEAAASSAVSEAASEPAAEAALPDGVYTADPFKDPAATRYAELSFDEALARQLKVMDSTAFSMCRDNDLPIIVFNFSDPDSLERILSGDTEAGTIVS